MTDREKAIVTAYTGINMLEGERFNEFYKYLEELYGRPVYTHEIPFLDVKEKSEDDFLKLCREEPSISPRNGKWIEPDAEPPFLFGGHSYFPPLQCSVCGRSALNEPWYFCPNCGARMDMRGEQDDD